MLDPVTSCAPKFILKLQFSLSPASLSDRCLTLYACHMISTHTPYQFHLLSTFRYFWSDRYSLLLSSTLYKWCLAQMESSKVTGLLEWQSLMMTPEMRPSSWHCFSTPSWRAFCCHQTACRPGALKFHRHSQELATWGDKIPEKWDDDNYEDDVKTTEKAAWKSENYFATFNFLRSLIFSWQDKK